MIRTTEQKWVRAWAIAMTWEQFRPIRDKARARYHKAVERTKQP